MMALSIAVMMGATRIPAVAAEATSAPSRRPRLCVFHCVALGVVVVDGVGLIISGLRVAPALAAIVEGVVAVVLHVTVGSSSKQTVCPVVPSS